MNNLLRRGNFSFFREKVSSLRGKISSFRGKFASFAWSALLMFLGFFFAGDVSLLAQLQPEESLPPGITFGRPDKTTQLYQEAMSAMNFRRLKIAREKLEQIVKDDPKHVLAPRATIELARVLVDERNFDRAIEILTPLADRPVLTPDVRFARELLLKTLAELQRFKQGIDLLEKWRKNDPGDTEIGRSLAGFYLQSGRVDEGRLLLEGLLEQTADPEVFNDLLKLAVKSATVETLLNTIEARRARYKSVDFLGFTVNCLLAMKQEASASQRLREAPETRASIPLLQKLARLDLDAERPEQALESFRRIEELGGRDWENIKAVGHCLFLLKRVPEAVKTWRNPLVGQQFSTIEAFSQLTDVLIEHKLYQEALGVFDEARRMMGNPAAFAEERAGVLEVLNRRDEALEEYLMALGHGMYKPDIFDKLYKNDSVAFPLADRLLKAIQVLPSLSLKKALLEVYYRTADTAIIPRILDIEGPGAGFDDILAERITQAMAGLPDTFTRSLMLALIRRQRASTLAYRLSLQLLDWPDPAPAERAEIRQEASLTADSKPNTDIMLESQLLVRLGRFAFEVCRDVADARARCEAVLTMPGGDLLAAPRFEASLLLMRLSVAAGDFTAAANYFNQSRTDERNPEDSARLRYEEAWMRLHKGDFQGALDVLKTLTADCPESMWLNDGLRLALFLTMNSTGSLDPLNRFLAAERAAMLGSTSAAIASFTDLAITASSSGLGLEAASRVLLLSEGVGSDAVPLIASIDAFIGAHPAHYAVADLLLRKLSLLQQRDTEKTVVSDLLKDFLDRFPGDLRARRVSLLMEALMKIQAPAEKTPPEAVPEKGGTNK
ncbi:MAG: tetratricopeptide repeat protein [Candidatus Ozemobacteraceae bacterium]